MMRPFSGGHQLIGLAVDHQRRHRDRRRDDRSVPLHARIAAQLREVAVVGHRCAAAGPRCPRRPARAACRRRRCTAPSPTSPPRASSSIARRARRRLPSPPAPTARPPQAVQPRISERTRERMVQRQLLRDHPAHRRAEDVRRRRSRPRPCTAAASSAIARNRIRARRARRCGRRRGCRRRSCDSAARGSASGAATTRASRRGP